MKYTLRDYQQKMYNDIIDQLDQGVKTILCQAPTRSGKSGVISKIIEYFSVEKLLPVWFLAHTKILISQMSEELSDHGIRHGIIKAGEIRRKLRVQVISKASLLNRLKQMRAAGWADPHIIIIDEAHMAMSKTFQDVLKEFPGTIVIGFTATPCRLDGKGLDYTFEKLLIGPLIPYLQKIGILCKIITYVVDLFDDSGVKSSGGDYNQKQLHEKTDKPWILDSILSEWESKAKNKKTMTFCVDIQHAEDMAETFNEAGYPSVAISSKDVSRTDEMGFNLFHKKLRGYYYDEYVNLCSVGLFVMGFTIQECECIIQARPTQSLMIYMQTIGRGMMPSPGKEFLINLDCVNNYKRHGLIEEDRVWSLKSTKNPTIDSKYKRCPICQRGDVPLSERKCPFCGHLWTETEEAGVRRLPESKAGEMVLVGSGDDNYSDTVRSLCSAKTIEEAYNIGFGLMVDPESIEKIYYNVLKNGG